MGVVGKIRKLGVQNAFQKFRLLKSLILWVLLLVPLGLAVGTICAVFLWLLDQAKHLRIAHPNILFGLPVAGIAVALIYYWCGGRSNTGNNLVIDEIHTPSADGVPLRMAPLVLLGTVISHLFGASVGREGTAVQVGSALASGYARLWNLNAHKTRVLLIAGVAAGFGAVFGTPVAGAVFSLEILICGRLDYAALVPATITAVIADWTCHVLGARHTAYHIGFQAAHMVDGTFFHVDPVLLMKIIIASVLFGLSSRIFTGAIRILSVQISRICKPVWLRPALGGVATIALVEILGTRDFLGLGVESSSPHAATIVHFFGPETFPWAWAGKLVFTVLALATGFKGGEVTPLFYIGAGLGNILAYFMDVPTDLLAGVGFVAVFSGAANTPLACTFMAVELYGATHTIYYVCGCFIAYLCSGYPGIYSSQRPGTPKILLETL